MAEIGTDLEKNIETANAPEDDQHRIFDVVIEAKAKLPVPCVMKLPFILCSAILIGKCRQMRGRIMVAIVPPHRHLPIL